MLARNLKFGKKNKLFENMVVFGVFVCMLAGIIGFFLYQNINIEQKRSHLEERLRELQEEFAELSAQRGVLQANIEEIHTEEYQEKVLREQGLYQKEGEEVVTILPSENTPQELLETTENQDKRSWWNPFSWF